MTGLDATIEVRARAVSAGIRVARGETVAVMGPSGAGKSTVVEAIAGLVALSGGQVRVASRVVSDPAPRVPVHRRGTVLLGQDPRVLPHLIARDNIAFGPRATGVGRAEAARHADELLHRVGLAGAGDERPGDLSGGQRQRVGLARALAVAPDVLLLDEPLTSHDPVTAAGIRGVLADLTRDGTCVRVTHDAVDAAALAARLVVMERGAVTQEGAVRDVLAHPATAFVASIAGVNRVTGRAAGGCWTDGRVTSAGTLPATAPEGADLVAVFRPQAVTLRPAGAAPHPLPPGM
ncbi:MAG: ABC transporter ATP-binding protein, partial [Microbacterium sp.]